MQEEQPKIQKVWQLPDSPEHLEMTAGAVVAPDNIKPGQFMMVVCSSAVKMEMTPMGPKIERVDNDPSFGGILSVRAYCYPFVACMVLTGKWRDTRMALDIRRHKLVTVTQHFARCMMEPQQIMALDQAKKNPPKKRKGPNIHPIPNDVMEMVARKLQRDREAARGIFRAEAPPEMENPEEHLRRMLEEGGWQVKDPNARPPDAQGKPPLFPDDLPPPDDFNDVEDDDFDEYEEEGEGARL